jgi:hypothetical protein
MCSIRPKSEPEFLFKSTKTTISHWRYPYIDIVVGLAWSDDPESYAGGSVATGRASHARQVKGDDPDKKAYPGPPEINKAGG